MKTKKLIKPKLILLILGAVLTLQGCVNNAEEVFKCDQDVGNFDPNLSKSECERLELTYVEGKGCYCGLDL